MKSEKRIVAIVWLLACWLVASPTIVFAANPPSCCTEACDDGYCPMDSPTERAQASHTAASCHGAPDGKASASSDPQASHRSSGKRSSHQGPFLRAEPSDCQNCCSGVVVATAAILDVTDFEITVNGEAAGRERIAALHSIGLLNRNARGPPFGA